VHPQTKNQKAMNKISLIIRREYLTRVRKKSFIIMSAIGPLLFAALMVLPAVFASMEDKELRTIAVIDESMVLTSYASGQPVSVIPETEYLKFTALEDVNLETLKENFESTGYYAVLYIPSNIFNSERAILYSNKQPSLDISSHIRNAMEREIENMKLVANDIENLDQILKEVETNISISNIKWTKSGEEKRSNTGLVMGIGYASGLLIYMFIFIYGSMTMRGVIEEKSSRIVEVIVSSVRPFQLMMGKIIGVGMVGLTQFVIWIVFTGILVVGATSLMGFEMQQSATDQSAATALFAEGASAAGEEAAALSDEIASGGDAFIADIMASFESIRPGKILLAFLFFFLFGYLMYGSLFAIIGSAVDNETETQQFMLPITLPLILGIIVMANVMNNPHGPLAFWFSIFPLTSPVVMMVRMPFEVPAWELALSAVLLILSILGAVWMAGKIYRTGILMYGKKVTYKELWKWLRYKN
jgi:ABC-2 type transport system permease protein